MKKLETLEDAFLHLSTIVNWSEASVKQKRLDLNMVTASERDFYLKALAMVNAAIQNKEISRDDFNRRLGLG